jgi:hypothetical protein
LSSEKIASIFSPFFSLVGYVKRRRRERLNNPSPKFQTVPDLPYTTNPVVTEFMGIDKMPTLLNT